MLWDSCTEKLKALGGEVRMGRRVTALELDANGLWHVRHRAEDGSTEELVVDHVISSAPMRELVASITPGVSEAARSAAAALRYRDFLIVTLILKGDPPFSDNWVYIQDPKVKCGRVQNFKSWSPDMVPDPQYASLGCEYFCHQGDGLWNSSDEELLRLASDEMAEIGLVKPGSVIDSCVVRQPKAYPVYDGDYARHVDAVRAELDERYPNLHLVGRNGMHKYNNQDHSMMTAMLCVENILADKPVYNLWRVNQDAEYHESGEAGAQGKTGRLVPERLRRFTSRPPAA
jgi:protoporphyrinogen oxidase